MNSADDKSIRPFVFEQSFDMLTADDDVVIVKKKEEEEETPTFSEEELQAARETAYQEGMQAGLQEAMNGIEQHVSATLEVVGATLDRIDEQQKTANEMIARETMDLAIAAVEKLLPQFARQGGAAEVESFVQDILAQILEEPRIAVTVSEELAPELERNLIDLAGRIGFGGAIAVVGDATLGPADCRIRWSEGDAERVLEATRREIAALTSSIAKHEGGTLDVSAEAPMPEPMNDLSEPAGDGSMPEVEPVSSEAAPETETMLESAPNDPPLEPTEIIPPMLDPGEEVMDVSTVETDAALPDQDLPSDQEGTTAEMPVDPT